MGVNKQNNLKVLFWNQKLHFLRFWHLTLNCDFDLSDMDPFYTRLSDELHKDVKYFWLIMQLLKRTLDVCAYTCSYLFRNFNNNILTMDAPRKPVIKKISYHDTGPSYSYTIISFYLTNRYVNHIYSLLKMFITA